MIIEPTHTALKFKLVSADHQQRLDDVIAAVMAARAFWPTGPRTVGYEMADGYGYFDQPHWKGVKNHKDRVGDIITYARIHGLIPWKAISDASGRDFNDPEGWLSPGEYIMARARYFLGFFQYSPTHNQPIYHEVWIEKADLLATVDGPASEFGVPSVSCGGFQSATFMKQAARRFKAEKRPCKILYFGDLNTGGHRITKAIISALTTHHHVNNITLERCGLLPEQVLSRFSPHELKGTKADKREFMECFGISKGYEINALLHEGISELVRTTLEEHIDGDLLAEAIEGQEEMQESVESLGDWVRAEVSKEALERDLMTEEEFDWFNDN